MRTDFEGAKVVNRAFEEGFERKEREEVSVTNFGADFSLEESFSCSERADLFLDLLDLREGAL